MKLKKRWMKYTALALCLSMALPGGCSDKKEENDGTVNGSESTGDGATNDNELDFTNFYVTKDFIELEAFDTVTSEEGAVAITLQTTTAEVADSSRVSVSGSSVTIQAAGTYLVSGTLSDGELIVDVDKKDEVHLIFDNVNITNADGPAVYAKHGKIVLTLKAGTVNTLTDGAEPAVPEGETEPIGACLYSKDDLTINGDGKLIVNANYKDAVNCKDVLKLLSGSYELTAADDGIVGKDAVWVLGGDISITAAGDGIKSTNVEKEESAYIYVEAGTLDITAEADALQADSSMLIEGGTFRITTGGGSKNGAAHYDNMFGGNRWNNGQTTEEDTSTSMKGIRVAANLTINGGDFTMDCADDALHSNWTATINGGTFQLASGDDGIHAEEAVTINAGNITISTSYEGIEARIITIAGGTTYVTSSDDGVNATAESTTSQDFGFGGRGMMEDVQDAEFIMNGGFLYLNASGDGLDSNGTAEVNGGICIIDGPTNHGNGALDYGKTCVVNGGILVAAGASGMAMNPAEDGQGFISMTYGSTQSAGTVLVVTDVNGEVIFAYTPAKTFSHVVLSAPGIINGATLKLYTGGSIHGENQNGYYTSGATYTAGTLVAEFSTTEAGNYFNESGKTTGSTGGMGGFGGGMGGFGGGGRGDRDKWNRDDSAGTTEDGFPGMPDGERPEMPEGGFPDGERPEMPEGGFPGMPDGERPDKK